MKLIKEQDKDQNGVLLQKCDECDEVKSAVIEFEFDDLPNLDSDNLLICKDCLKKALEMLEE